MHFASDNWAGAHPKIAESLSLHAAGFAAAYGASEIDKRVEQHFNELFEREVAVFLSEPVRLPIRWRWPASTGPAAFRWSTARRM